MAIVVAALALLSVGGSSGATKTTAPSSDLEIFIKLTDSTVSLAIYALSAYSGNETYLASRADVVRGDVAIFKVTNDGKKAHNFVFLDKRTPTLKPGRSAILRVALLRRGSFRYTSTVNAARGLSGVLSVH